MKAIPTSGSLKRYIPALGKLRDRRGFLRGENKRGMRGEGQRGVWRDKIEYPLTRDVLIDNLSHADSSAVCLISHVRKAQTVSVWRLLMIGARMLSDGLALSRSGPAGWAVAV